MSVINNILAVYLQRLFGFEVCMLEIMGPVFYGLWARVHRLLWCGHCLIAYLVSHFFSLGDSECVNSEVLYLKLFH